MSMNTLGQAKRNIVRADKAAVDKLARFGSATVHEAMGRLGLMKPYMRPVKCGWVKYSWVRRVMMLTWVGS